ncbi:hypothetical protein LCGC14_1991270, partial [marine sediment metagenome]
SEQVRRKALPNVTLLPFQPFDVLPLSLASADCVITCLDEGYEGLSVPSKTYYALAAGADRLDAAKDDDTRVDLTQSHSDHRDNRSRKRSHKRPYRRDPGSGS